MNYVAIVMMGWYFLITILTIYGMIEQKTAGKFDVFIGLILAPALTFLAAFILIFCTK